MAPVYYHNMFLTTHHVAETELNIGFTCKNKWNGNGPSYICGLQNNNLP